MLTLIDGVAGVTATNLTQVANGLRNPAGFAFHPSTGDLYFQDNGIDGLTDPNEPLSAFAGESIRGTWQLQVSDNAEFDIGTLNHWCLGLNGAAP